MRAHRRKLTYVLVGVVGLSVAVLAAAARFWLVTVLALAVIVMAVMNGLVVRRLSAQVAPFAARSGVRNVDCLVIGDLCRAGDLARTYAGGGASFVALTVPGRTLRSSYEILRHAYGILREDGPVVVIAVRRDCLGEGYSSFDLPVFRLSPTSVRRLGLESLLRWQRVPMLAHPLRSLELLLGPMRSFEDELAAVPPDMLEFCEERGLELHVICG